MVHNSTKISVPRQPGSFERNVTVSGQLGNLPKRGWVMVGARLGQVRCTVELRTSNYSGQALGMVGAQN